mmetsp:Transcript_25952/g.31820  ORF Transcript_25952/g.31820 Transcript_25952/m.31820 type:complete len:377 (-) Transcript_25952:146-1276(-)
MCAKQAIWLSLLLIISSKSNALTVGIAGATGRVGRLVVENCVRQGYDVTAIVRNVDKAKGDPLLTQDGVTIRPLDFAAVSADTAEGIVGSAFEGVDRVIWCASGFVDVKGDGDGGETTKEALDVVGMKYLLPTLSSTLKPKPSDDSTAPPPAFIMLSSAGVTRPGWDAAKQEKFVGCADIPIVRMNPGGILDRKVVAESMLRDNAIGNFPYCVVRPTGLKFEDKEWPRGRTLFSQGDVAVGRMNANDLASNLVDLLNEPSATGKTFECVTLAGYPPPKSITTVLEKLNTDATIDNDSDGVYASFQLMQQLLPGEEQDATRLEMGKTYEQVDRGEVDRARGAAPTEREQELAGSVVYDGDAKKGFRNKLKRIFGSKS